jgi:hypothetical protein
MTSLTFYGGVNEIGMAAAKRAGNVELFECDLAFRKIGQVL